MWGHTQIPIAELTAWAILAEVASMKEGMSDDIWADKEPDKMCQKIMRDLDSNIKLQDDTSGGWKPVLEAKDSEVRTYSTAMSVWSELDAMSTPRVRTYIGKRYLQSIEKGLFWLKNAYMQQASGWVPKPSRPGQTTQFLGLTSQIVCIIELAQSQPEFKFVASWQPFREAKQRLITSLSSVTRFSMIKEDQISSLDQAVPQILELEGSTFLVYPWALAACHMLKEDASVSESDRKAASLEEIRFRAMAPDFDEKLMGGSEETYEFAEALIAVSLIR
jgi:hypothetical protein